jgi:pSer/pThr/pTyr-binding forkhead associated (FHA) protein
MKLVFPNGEHGQVFLTPGPNRIGSDPGGAVVLDQPGVLPAHCVIHVSGTGANLQVPGVGGGAVSVNGKAVADIMGLRTGDSLQIGPVLARFVVVEEARSAAAAGEDEDSNATRVRMALPKFLLRGLSGAVFGRVYPVTGPIVIGRAAECDISVPADEMSRRHALLKPTADGLTVEDQGSANGTYVNDKRVQQGFLRPGDELRLDAVRFLLVAPGVEMATAQASGTPAAPPRGPMTAQKMQMWASILLTIAAIAVIFLLIRQR